MDSGPEWIPLTFTWAAMMVVMMLPSGLPMLMAFRRVCRRLYPEVRWLPGLFVAGYAGIWLGFSVILAWTQWHGRRYLGADLPAWITPFLFFLAGLYQFSPWKHACLRGCRSPLGFLLTGWQAGRFGAVRMGLHHGVLCVGCCWALMTLMLGVGMMTFTGMLVITAVITLERLMPVAPQTISSASGVLLLAWAVVLVQRTP